MSAGIDYGMGTTNVDKSNGTRYGVIPANDVGQAWYDDAESDYGEPCCPKCGNTAVDSAKVNNDLDEEDSWPQLYSHGCADFACESCEVYLDSSDVYGESPVAFTYSGEGYNMHQGGDDCDIFVLKSPYYTFAMFCSPCAPGAGHLLNPSEQGVKTYCLGHDWFEDGKAPYPVYDVATGEIVDRLAGTAHELLQGEGGAS